MAAAFLSSITIFLRAMRCACRWSAVSNSLLIRLAAPVDGGNVGSDQQRQYFVHVEGRFDGIGQPVEVGLAAGQRIDTQERRGVPGLWRGPAQQRGQGVG